MDRAVIDILLKKKKKREKSTENSFGNLSKGEKEIKESMGEVVLKIL